jgi:hypothetical protein
MVRNPFRIREFAVMFDKCIELASDNGSEYYYGSLPGPKWPRRGAGHRCAFWDGYFGIRSLYSRSQGTYGYAAYRAGVEFRKKVSR